MERLCHYTWLQAGFGWWRARPRRQGSSQGELGRTPPLSHLSLGEATEIPAQCTDLLRPISCIHNLRLGIKISIPLPWGEAKMLWEYKGNLPGSQHPPAHRQPCWSSIFSCPVAYTSRFLGQLYCLLPNLVSHILGMPPRTPGTS